MASLRPRSSSARILLVLALLLGVLVLPSNPGIHDASAAALTLRYLYGSGSATGGKVVSLRVELTAPAASGGATVALTSSSSLIRVPASVKVPAGQTEATVSATTVPTATSTDVRISAAYGGVTKSRTIRVLEPYLSSVSVQTKMRAGGTGKITIRFSGRLYSGGVDVRVRSNRPSIIQVPGTVHVEGGRETAIVDVNPTFQYPDVPVTFTISFDGRTVSGTTIVHNYGPGPTATPTRTPSVTSTPISTSTSPSTSTPTATPSVTVTSTPTATFTATATSTPSQTLTPTATVTQTPRPPETLVPTATPQPFFLSIVRLDSGSVADVNDDAQFRLCGQDGVYPVALTILATNPSDVTLEVPASTTLTASGQCLYVTMTNETGIFQSGSSRLEVLATGPGLNRLFTGPLVTLS